MSRKPESTADKPVAPVAPQLPSQGGAYILGKDGLIPDLPEPRAPRVEKEA